MQPKESVTLLYVITGREPKTHFAPRTKPEHLDVQFVLQDLSMDQVPFLSYAKFHIFM